MSDDEPFGPILPWGGTIEDALLIVQGGWNTTSERLICVSANAFLAEKREKLMSKAIGPACPNCGHRKGLGK